MTSSRRSTASGWTSPTRTPRAASSSADALTYAEQLGATHLVDVATLTGAVSRALGDLVSGAFGTPQPFVDDVFAAGARAGERYWQLPLVEEYRADMESWYGDLVNFSRNNEGGLVKSALFISEFVTKPWVHLDIAGTGYFRRAMPWASRGATGVSHATLVELALAGAKPADGRCRRPRGRWRRTPVDPLVALAGAASGWPGASRPTGSPHAGRPTRTARSGKLDWRTILVVVLLGGAAFGLTVERFRGHAEQLAVRRRLSSWRSSSCSRRTWTRGSCRTSSRSRSSRWRSSAFVTGVGPYVHSLEDLCWAAVAGDRAAGRAVPAGDPVRGRRDREGRPQAAARASASLAGAPGAFDGLVAGALLAGVGRDPGPASSRGGSR